MITFQTAFDRLMGNEGGYSNNEQDPGGETNWGIAKRSYPDVNIKALTRADAATIYMRDFWAPLGSIDPSVKFQVFDAAVNHGIQNALRMLQRAAGVLDDGHFGPMSVAAVLAMDRSDVLMLFLAERLDFMRRLTRWSVFGAGWAGRIATNLRYAAKDN